MSYLDMSEPEYILENALEMEKNKSPWSYNKYV